MEQVGPSVNNQATHCLIVFPNRAAVFDNEGRLLGPSGNVIGFDHIETLPSWPDPVLLTTEHLNLKNLTEALESMKRHGSKTTTPTSTPATRTSTDTNSNARLEVASIITMYGSAVPTPSVVSVASQIAQDGDPGMGSMEA